MKQKDSWNVSLEMLVRNQQQNRSLLAPQQAGKHALTSII